MKNRALISIGVRWNPHTGWGEAGGECWWNMAPFQQHWEPARTAPPAPQPCRGSHGPTASRWSTKQPRYPSCDICSAALQHHPVPKRVCPVIKGWLHRACSRSMAFLNSLSLRRRPHNERVSAGQELETDFVLLGKVMFTDHSLGVPDGWGGRSPQHYPEWPWKSWHISKRLLLFPPLCSISDWVYSSEKCHILPHKNGNDFCCDFNLSILHLVVLGWSMR